MNKLQKYFPASKQDLLMWKLTLDISYPDCYYTLLGDHLSEHGREAFQQDFVNWNTHALEDEKALQRTCMQWIEHVCRYAPSTLSWAYTDDKRSIVIMVCDVCIGSMEDDCNERDFAVREQVILTGRHCKEFVW